MSPEITRHSSVCASYRDLCGNSSLTFCREVCFDSKARYPFDRLAAAALV